MAIQILNTTTPISHNAEHDIESIFYVLLYLCLKLDGPDVWHHNPCRIDRWFKPNVSFASLAEIKLGFLQLFGQILETELPSYFKNFYDLFGKLHTAMFPDCRGSFRINGISHFPGNVARHGPILGILKQMYDDLPEVDPAPPSPTPTPTSTPVSSKRKAGAVSPLDAKRTLSSWQGPIKSSSTWTRVQPPISAAGMSSPEHS